VLITSQTEVCGYPIKELTQPEVCDYHYSYDGNIIERRKNSMKVRPLGDRVLVKPLEVEEKKKGGIIIPDTAKEKPQEGKVIAVGKGKITEEGKTLPLDVKVGDKILFGKYSGNEIKIDDEDYLIVKEEDILGIIE
jgi:chaperonin GroES